MRRIYLLLTILACSWVVNTTQEMNAQDTRPVMGRKS